MAFSESHSTSTFLLLPLSYSSFFDICHNPPHIFLHLSSLPDTNNSLSLTPLSSISLYVQLLVCYGVTRLSLFSISHLSAHKLFPSSILSLLLSATLLLAIFHFYPCFLHLLYYSNYLFIFTSSFFYFFYYIYL